MRPRTLHRRGRALALATGALIVAGCATTSAAPAGEITHIVYETGPCFGACPIYRLEVGRDGSGRFDGERFTAVTGERRFDLTPAQFHAFARHLEPLRPASGERRYAGEACAEMATDLPTVDVTWRSADGGEQRLHFYFGCDMERNRALAERLRSAPDHLPVAALIGPDR